jgi:uncharacterized membrane protein YhaH (DUF805 family)
MRRADFWLLAPVVVAAALIFVLNGGEIGRADHFVFQVLAISVVAWILRAASIGVRRMIERRQRK